jgi:hypothetical protein
LECSARRRSEVVIAYRGLLSEMRTTSNHPLPAFRVFIASELRAGVGATGRLLRRPIRQQGLVLEAALTLWAAKTMVRVLSFDRWRRSTQQQYHQHSCPPPRERVAEIVWAVDRVSQCWSGILTCLPRALAVRSMMARRHWGCRLEIGVARDERGVFESHAWVEHEGEVIIGNVPNLERYAKLPLWHASDTRNGAT